MSADQTLKTHHKGRIQDARGRVIWQLDPVRMCLLHQHTSIPAETLRTMTDELLPDVRRQRLLQIISVALGVLLVVGGNLVYFRCYSTWKGFDQVNITISVIQAVVIGSGPYLAYRLARSRYSHRVGAVMLKHRHCPHCGYDLRLLPVDAVDGATVCPECGCAWILDHTET